jgi:hypothetical protein
MHAVDRKYLLDHIKSLIIRHGRVSRIWLYIMVMAIWINTCDIEKDIHRIKHQLQQEEVK